MLLLFNLMAEHRLTSGQRMQGLCIPCSCPGPVNSFPARFYQNLALCKEGLFLNHGQTAGIMKYGCREKNSQKPLHDHLVDLQLRLGQGTGQDRGRNDRKMITDLCIIKNPFTFFQIPFFQGLAGKGTKLPLLLAGHYLFDRGEIIFRQAAAVGAGIGNQFMTFIQGLGQAQGIFSGKPETGIRLPLQQGKIIERW